MLLFREWWMREDVAGSVPGPFQDNDTAFAWKDWKSHETP
jgi:hypothetical protein